MHSGEWWMPPLSARSVLEIAPMPLGKAAILEAALSNGCQIESVWQEAINSLLAEERVAREGEKRGAKYRMSQVPAALPMP